MLYVIIILIILGIIGVVIEWIADFFDAIGGIGIAAIALLVIAYFAFSWLGVFVAIGGIVLVGLFWALMDFIGKTVKEHDESKKETAKIKQESQQTKLTHDNDNALLEELNKNCYWLGCMNADDWRKKLPNFVNRSYTSSFDTITQNFAEQIEQQYILQNNDWFEPYKRYILEHVGGATVTKMLNEVDCPQLKMTHCTPDGDLVNTWLVRGTKRVSKDVPELFRSTFIKEINENVFTPTEYLKKLYNQEDTLISNVHTEEIDFDDL